MHFLVLTSWLCLPLFPLNPVAQDTLPPFSAHVSAGIGSPNRLTGPTAELTAKYEVLLFHPLVARTAIDYRIGKVTSKLYPKGILQGATLSLEFFAYRGTRRLTGYLGLGVVYAYHSYSLSKAAADSLRTNHLISDIDVIPTFGYRLTLGLRFHRSVSLEIGITEVSPKLKYIQWLSPSSYATSYEKVRLSEARVTLGYLWSFDWW